MSNIEWTDSTWNPARGCSRVSAGCDNCYAIGQAHRFSEPGAPYDGLTTLRRGKPDWVGMARLVPAMLDRPLRWKKPRRIFVNSMSDLFHESLSNEDIAAVFGVMAAAPQHTFQVLTKRPKRMREWFEWVTPNEDGTICDAADEALMKAGFDTVHRWRLLRHLPRELWPLPNVHLGVSVEDQRTADERIPILLDTPAALRFVSAEPLLGPLDLSRYMWPVCESWPSQFTSPDEARKAGATVNRRRLGLVLADCVFLQWVIVGGESGPGARPCNVDWIRTVVRDCKSAGVPVFVKQLGSASLDPGNAEPTGRFRTNESTGKRELEVTVRRLRSKKGDDPEEWPEDLRVREFPGDNRLGDQ